MTGRPRRPRSGDGDGTTPRRPRTTTPATSVRQAQQSVTTAAQKGRPSGGTGTPGIGHNSSRFRRRPGENNELPPGHYYDAQGYVRGPDGRYARDPNHVPNTHDRTTEYPRRYRESTHDAMAARYTDQGRAQGGVPVDRHGNKIPHDQLTWRDERGRRIPYDDLTYDHRPPVAQHWNDGGNNTGRAGRADWYNDPAHLRPMRGSGPDGNFAEGARSGLRYSQDVGPNYSDK